jgi:hypothetical protein
MYSRRHARITGTGATIQLASVRLDESQPLGRVPTPYESARLNLQLFEMRREPVLREARGWYINEFFPQSIDEYQSVMTGPRNPWVRMVIGYWDMACSMVVHGAIDHQMFLDAHGEVILSFAKLHPFLPALRQLLGPHLLKNVEAVVMAMPDAEQQMTARYSRMYARFKSLQAAPPASDGNG